MESRTKDLKTFLYILEPAIELESPEFRFATLRVSIIPQIKSLRSTGAEVHLIVGEAVANRAIQEGYSTDMGSFSVVDYLDWTQGENYLERSLRHQSRDYRPGEVDRLCRVILAHLPDNFLPDIIVIWESPMYFLEGMFPRVRILYQMPGFFSRAPFPQLVKFDVGLLDRSSGCARIRDKTPNVDGELEQLRALDKSFIDSLHLVESILSEVKEKFQSILLLPLQIDRYFMVSFLLERRSQFDILLEILQKCPENIGVLVTNYRSGALQTQVLSDGNIEYLRRKFRNFLYISSLDGIESVSQLLLPSVDGVFTVSSSVGYQAAYWGKPFFSLGASHLVKYHSTESLETFLDQVGRKVYFPQDDIIRRDLLEGNFPADLIVEAPERFRVWINLFNNPTGSNFWTSSQSFLQDFIQLRREQLYLKSPGFKSKVNTANTWTHCEQLSAQIRRCEIVSFDIFDTLLFRPFDAPADMFDFMSEEVTRITCNEHLLFRDVRRQSEKLAFEAARSRNEGETSIDEIYEHFQTLTGCSEEQASEVKALEMRYEYELLYARRSAKMAFNLALGLGKRVIIVSDMYLPREFLETILQKNGYCGYDRIFVSSELKQKKHSGRLFDLVLAELGRPPQSILHVGDNLVADILKAKEKGMRAFHLVKASEKFKETAAYADVWRRDESRHTNEMRILLAVIGNTLHDNPYLADVAGSLFGGDAWRLGYYGFGVFLMGYVKWVIEQAIRDKMCRLYFLSRDGLIMKKAYDILAKCYTGAPESRYLLCSRRAVNLAKIKDDSGILDLLNVDYAKTTVRHLFSARFGINESDLDLQVLKRHGLEFDSQVNQEHRDVLRQVLLAHNLKICAIAKVERDNYLQFLENEGLFEAGEVAVVDIGYAGTMQESLYSLAEQRKRIDGYYLMTFRQALQRVESQGLFAKAYLGNFIDRHDTFHPFCRFVPLYETMFSTAEPTFIKMGRDWKGRLGPVFMDRFPNETNREALVTKVHSASLQFVSEVVRVLGSRMQSIDIEPNKSMRVLNHYFSSPHPTDSAIMCSVVFEDCYGGAGLKVILGEHNDTKTNIVWKQGKEALKGLSSPAAGNRGDFSGKHVEKRFVELIIRNLCSRKKYSKFIRDPRIFFGDSKKLLSAVMEKVYFLRN